MFKNLALTCITLCVFAFSSVVSAQITTPQPSPAATLTQRVGLVDVTVNYSRPSAKGRAIFGADIVPFGAAWRTGANGATTLTFSGEVMINGVKIPAGKYAIYSIPNKDEWEIIINKNVNLGGSTAGYKAEEDVVRFKVKPTSTEMTETFTVGFSNLTDNSANFDISWEKTKVSFPIMNEVDAVVMKQIETFAKNPQAALAQNYSQAAAYYLAQDKDLKKALEWIEESIKINPTAFWNVRTKALIQAKMKDYKAAIETATLSKTKAAEAKNDDYVRMNEKSIAEWSKMK